MKKSYIFIGMICMILFFYITPYAHADDRSFIIEQVDIYVEVDEDGVMHVSEYSTYNFSGSFKGTERSLLGEVSNFKGYEVSPDVDHENISSEDMEELTVRNEDDLYRIYISSEDEKRTVLYTYDIHDEIKKYADVAEVGFDFYPKSNNADIGELNITWDVRNAPEEDIHAFLHGDEGATVQVNPSEVSYHHNQFKSGMSAEVRIIFPANVVSDLPLKKDKHMEEKIIQDETTLMEKKELYLDRLQSIFPYALVGLLLLIIVLRWRGKVHPNHYHFKEEEGPEDHLDFLEKTDPLFVTFIQANGHVGLKYESIITALFSLKRRGIISMKETPFKEDPSKMTYVFYWENESSGTDEVDAYLRTWLFTEKENGMDTFYLETIIYDENEKPDIITEKKRHFTTHFDEWIEMVKNREAFSGWYEPYKPFKYLSLILTGITFIICLYTLSITPITTLTFQILIGGISVLTMVSLIWCWNKWILSSYYFTILITLVFALKWSVLILPFLGIVFLSWFGVLVISSREWEPEIAKLDAVLYYAKQKFSQKKYPLSDDAEKNERKFELAVTIGETKSFADQLGKEFAIESVKEYYTPMVHHPEFVVSRLYLQKLVFYSAMTHIPGSTSMGSSPTSGSGGAGAF